MYNRNENEKKRIILLIINIKHFRILSIRISEKLILIPWWEPHL